MEGHPLGQENSHVDAEASRPSPMAIAEDSTASRHQAHDVNPMTEFR